MNHLDPSAVRVLLAGRGYASVKYTPVTALPEALHLSLPEKRRFFYRVMQRYAARLIFHDLSLHPRGATVSQLLHYASERSTREILTVFQNLGLVRMIEDRFQFTFSQTLRIGDFLEWLVATVLQREFSVPAITNVSLQGSKTGGDYDVLGNWLGKLVFVEVKSAPPKGIHNPEIAGFLDRIRDILPDIAVFLVDTHLRVRDKIVLMFEEELIKANGIGSLRKMPINKIHEQVFQLNHFVYIMNSKRALKSNFRIVFRDYLRYNSPVKMFF